ncbi:cytochrome c oxidase biogenesis protein Cmc1 like-domain-containing protein [Clohesyomyces aquaticus]|uniref:COX assembly mitochondrial protein n=1 Tax=Clohesyomyces aquaticus TaxID=1231657 RepID=A0A1Y1ZWJ2_9PLEO|nr:cytochrome c oxidase biogenesis protein Cmc1 like-domain-containing protein [Clohesyomyces aquaticus]
MTTTIPSPAPHPQTQPQPQTQPRNADAAAGPQAPQIQKLPSNPTPLSAPQEQQVRDLYYKNVRDKCAEEIKAFATCARSRTFTMVWACRSQKLAMNSCMVQYQGQDELDKARAEWFQLAGERRRVREEKERELAEARRKHKEWWALDEEGRLQGRRAEVERQRVEREAEAKRVGREGGGG